MDQTICYLRIEDEALMLYKTRANDLYTNKWVPPGGCVEPFETPLECIVREYKEETGLKLVDIRYRGIANIKNWNIHSGIKKKFSQSNLFIYEANNARGEIRDPEEGCLKFINEQVIPSLPQRQGDPFIWSLVREVGTFRAYLGYNGEKLIYANALNLNNGQTQEFA